MNFTQSSDRQRDQDRERHQQQKSRQKTNKSKVTFSPTALDKTVVNDNGYNGGSNTQLGKTKKSMKLLILINLTIFVISLFVGATHAAPEADEVKSLPGWNKELPSKIYSGFISAGQDTQDGVTYNMHEQYFFVESENDPKNDPVLIWTNGGPGASSYFGLFVELGPFQANGNSLKTEEYNKTGVPTLFYNDYTWTKLGNVLILNSICCLIQYHFL